MWRWAGDFMGLVERDWCTVGGGGVGGGIAALQRRFLKSLFQVTGMPRRS